MRVTILGRGRVGAGLRASLRWTDLDTTLTSGRRPRAAALRGADTLVLAVPDGAYEALAAQLLPHLADGAVVLHCSGSRPVSVLARCREAGASVGAMHPLVSFTKRAPRLRGTSFVIDGDERAIRAAKKICAALGARPVIQPVHGAAYHAAAALSANGAAALATVAVEVFEKLGLSRREAERAIGALLRSVADNVESVGVPAALSGPILRGDADTVRTHRRALSEVDRGALEAYDGVAPAILTTARALGLDASRVRAVRRALKA